MDCPKCKKPGCAEDPAGGYWCQSCQYAWHPRFERINREKLIELVGELRTLATTQYNDWGGQIGAMTLYRVAQMIEEKFGLESPSDPPISDGFDDWP